MIHRDTIKSLLRDVIFYLKQIIENQNRIIHRLSVEHNNESRPFAYLDPDSREEASELRSKFPEGYDYIVNVLKLFLGWYDYTSNSCNKSK